MEHFIRSQLLDYQLISISNEKLKIISSQYYSITLTGFIKNYFFNHQEDLELLKE